MCSCFVRIPFRDVYDDSIDILLPREYPLTPGDYFPFNLKLLRISYDFVIGLFRILDVASLCCRPLAFNVAKVCLLLSLMKL